jgi:general secretion pathway protein H
MTWRSEPRGFTLVELLIVLAIMAAATTLFATYLHTGARGALLREATREMTASLNETRSLAITGNRTAALVIDAPAHAYRDPMRAHRIAPALAITVRGGVPVAGGIAIYFFPDGSSSGGSVDFAAGAASAAVSIDWFTGFASAHGIAAPPS